MIRIMRVPDAVFRRNCWLYSKLYRLKFEDGWPSGIGYTDAVLDEALRGNSSASDLNASSTQKETTMVSAANEPGVSSIFGGESVLIERLLPAARSRLVTIADDASLLQAAKLLRAGTDIVVVCELAGRMVGVITKTDVVDRISECQGASCTTAVALVMSVEVLQCTPDDVVQDVWSKMKSRGLKNIPITGVDGRPLGVLNARDALGVLLQGVENEETLLRDYVMGVGYH